MRSRCTPSATAVKRVVAAPQRHDCGGVRWQATRRLVRSLQYLRARCAPRRQVGGPLLEGAAGRGVQVSYHCGPERGWQEGAQRED
eukprot:2581627-Alexandrium_andersonii.AAC.1